MPISRWWINRPDLDAILDELARSATLVAPVRTHGEVVFQRVTGTSGICRDYTNSLVPPKRWLLPATERLVRFRVMDDAPTLEATPEDAPGDVVLFGVRSCDAAGFTYLTRFLSGESLGRPDMGDGPFLARRNAVTVLSVTCRRPGSNCMCICCKGGPALESGFDWQLTEHAHGWYVEVESARGQRLAERFAARLRPATEGETAEQRRHLKAVVETFHKHSSHKVRTMMTGRMVSQGRLPSDFWQGIGERCVECGGCAFVCPTCYCFNVADVADHDAGDGAGAGEAYDRIRLRDCCQLAGFVRQAGASYPRATCGERCQTRFFHKFSWQFVDRMQALGCTGCGRCTQVCLGGVGIDTVSDAILQANAESRTNPAAVGEGH
jgi:formate hydrogenlyase subunit 6/NADH:ubiquinone oxidoreductase subunit I